MGSEHERIAGFEVHPVASVFPLIGGEAFERLVEDIRANGLLEPIWRVWVEDPIAPTTRKPLILDGRNRLRACEAARVAPTFRDYEGDDPVAFVVSINVERRHLDESQRAIIASRLATLGHGQRKGDSSIELSQAEAAARLNVGVATLKRARVVLDRAVPEVVRAVELGNLTVSAAADLARLAPDDQSLAMARVQSAPSEPVPDADDGTRIDGGKLRRVVAEIEREHEREHAVATVATLPSDDRIRVVCCPVASLGAHVTDGSVDAIVTDPPYPREFLGVYRELGAVAKRILKPGGSCVVMIGQSYLPDIVAALSESLSYHWTCAYLTPGGQAVQLWDRKVNTFWKPLLWFVNGEHVDDRWVGDVARSNTNDNDKTRHRWGQSESGMLDVVERFTRPGDLVCDPFCGAGTTAVACALTTRRFVGCDIDEGCVAQTQARAHAALSEAAA